jgi:FAD/FMN-containing dehydrogenase
MSLPDDLVSLLSGEVSTDPSALAAASRDASLFSITPQAIAYPRDSTDIQKLVEYCNQHPGTSLTPRSGGTDMSGGPLNTSIIVDINRHLNKFKNISSHTATVEPGAFYRDFAKEVAKHNLLLPSYPASKDIATVGGMVANNSGGEKTLAYGKTEKYVRQIKAVLSDSHEYTFEKLSLKELQQKMAQKDFEGNLYRQIVNLIDKSEDIITAAKPKVSKNSTGYNLWNVYSDFAQQFDMGQLLIGSQGTLGIMTEVTFNLITPKPHSQMLVMFLKDTKDLANIITTTLRYHPESFESYDDHTLQIALKYFPEMMKQMGAGNLLSLTYELIPEFWMLVTSGLPALVLLAEFTGHDEIEIHRRAQACQSALKQFNLKTHLTKNSHEAQKYWTIRRESFNLLRHKMRHKHTAPFIDDLTVRPQILPHFLPRLNEIMSHYDIIYTIAGHVGDGNFHIIPLMDLTKPDQRAIIHELADKVYDLVFEFKGSMSGEHNDGLIRSHYLEKMYGPEIYGLFKQVKSIFDPNNIFNPGKKIGSSWEYAQKYLITE